MNSRSLIRIIAGIVIGIAFAAQTFAATLDFTFTLPNDLTTSAAVYDSTNHLVKTLWRKVRYKAGAHTLTWDGLNDAGATMPLATYTVKVLCNNTNYVWEGVIGNTSSSFTGEGIWRSGTNNIESLAINGTTAFVGMGYNEGGPQIQKFATATPQSTTAVKQFTLAGEFRYVATDGTRVYTANTGGGFGNSNNYTFITAYTISTNAPYPFSGVAGNPANKVILDTNPTWATDPESTFVGVIDIASQITVPPVEDPAFVAQQAATAIAVQTSGTVLAVAHGPLNTVRLFNKNTGASVGSISVTNPTSLSFTMNGNLLVVTGSSIKKYTSVGTTNTLALTIAAFTSPFSIAANPSNEDQFVVGDTSTHQFTVYNSATSTVVRTIGTSGGYSVANGPDVTTSKFTVGKPIAFQSDGSTWGYDTACERLLHFSNTGAYIEQIMYHLSYASTIDMNSPTRVFQGFLEYQIDYSKPLLPGDASNVAKGGNESWRLIKNWAVGLPASIVIPGDRFAGFHTVVGVYGKTFALAPDSSTGQNALIELPNAFTSGAARDTGIRLSNTWSLHLNLALRYGTVVNDGTPSGTQTFYSKDYTGFDGSGNPIWTPPASIGSTTAKADEPSFGRSYAGLCPPQLPITDNSVIPCFSGSAVGGFALGGVQTSGSDWLWKVAPCILDNIPLDGLGSFEVGDHGNTLSYPSNKLMFLGQNIIYGYHGEFWNQSQANQFMHFKDDGLFVGQFGTSGDIVSAFGEVSPGIAGNSLSPAISTAYNYGACMYAGDESHHGGLHRWRIDGMTSDFKITGSKAMSAGANTLTMTAPATLPFPYGLKAFSGTSAVRLQWLACSGATTYKVYRRDVAGTKTLLISGLAALTYDATSLTNGQPYFFYIIGIDSGGNEINRSEEIMSLPFDKTQRVANIGQAAFTPKSSTYRFDIASANLTKGGFPTSLHSMFKSLGVSANLIPFQTDLGSQGYVVFNTNTTTHAAIANIPAGLGYSLGSGWKNQDAYVSLNSKIDAVTTNGSAIIVDPALGTQATVNITTTDATKWHVLTVVSPDIFTDGRHYSVSLTSSTPTVQTATYTVDETFKYFYDHSQARIKGLNHIHQFAFKGNVTLKFTQLSLGAGQSNSAVLHSLYFDGFSAF